MVNTIRFGGLASGIDTEKLVKDLMKVEREPVNNLKRKKQLEEWRRDSYREMNALLYDFQRSLDSLRFASNLNKKKATSDNDAVVSVVAKGTPSLSNYSIKVNQLAKPAVPPSAKFTVSSSIPDASTEIGSSFTFEIITDSGTKQIQVEATDTINKVIDKVNKSASGVKATYFNNQLVFTSETEKVFKVKVVDGDGSSLDMGPVGTERDSSTGEPGTPAIVEINGVTHTLSSNTFTYDGIEFNVKQVTTSPLNIAVRTDEDAVFETIKNFVNKYNELIKAIDAKISEPKYKGYQPLLDEEKEQLPEKTAEKLENMAKSGILSRDPILYNALNSLRTALSTKLDGTDPAFDTLSEIGITGPPNGKNAYQEKGKLYIDEAKLRQAISENGDKVIQLFSQYSQSKSYAETGLAQRLYNVLGNTIEELSERAGSTALPVDDSFIGKSIKSIDQNIKVWEDRLKQIEDRYWKKFTEMEKAIAKYQSQSTWFANLLGGQQ